MPITTNLTPEDIERMKGLYESAGPEFVKISDLAAMFGVARTRICIMHKQLGWVRSPEYFAHIKQNRYRFKRWESLTETETEDARVLFEETATLGLTISRHLGISQAQFAAMLAAKKWKRGKAFKEDLAKKKKTTAALRGTREKALSRHSDPWRDAIAAINEARTDQGMDPINSASLQFSAETMKGSFNPDCRFSEFRHTE